MVEMKPNKGDVILVCILFATLSFFVVNEFNILTGFEQFSSNFTTLFAIIFGGELLSFAIYRIGMAKYRPKDEKGTIRQIEESIEEQESKGKHEQTN